MPIHVKGQISDVAPYVLLPGDPGRATYIAKTFLENPVLYTEYRSDRFFHASRRNCACFGKHWFDRGNHLVSDASSPSNFSLNHEIISEMSITAEPKFRLCGYCWLLESFLKLELELFLRELQLITSNANPKNSSKATTSNAPISVDLVVFRTRSGNLVM